MEAAKARISAIRMNVAVESVQIGFRQIIFLQASRILIENIDCVILYALTEFVRNVDYKLLPPIAAVLHLRECRRSLRSRLLRPSVVCLARIHLEELGYAVR